MMRVGTGFDLHRFGGDGPLMLAGIEIPSEPGLLGHSDADCVLHALADAILGAAALGDIGQHFPDTDPRFKGADSAELLAKVRRLVEAEGFRIGNVDCTILAEAPRLAPYREVMRSRIAEILGVSDGSVGVKATTFEGVGPIGRGEAIACQAIALLRESV